MIDAPISDVWNALADIGSISTWNPGVVASRKISTGTEDLGACRRCELGGRSYLEEEVVQWDPERALTMRITTTNLPFKAADIRFTLKPKNGGTEVTVAPIYTLKFGWIGRALDAGFVQARYRKGMVDLLRGLKRHVERNSAA